MKRANVLSFLSWVVIFFPVVCWSVILTGLIHFLVYPLSIGLAIIFLAIISPALCAVSISFHIVGYLKKWFSRFRVVLSLLAALCCMLFWLMLLAGGSAYF